MEFFSYKTMQFIPFCLSLLIVIVAGSFSIIKFMRKGPLFSREDRIVLYLLHVIIFISLISPAIALATNWIVMLMQNDNAFICYNADKARIIYETRSISGISETIVIASIAVLIPFLTMLWNNANKIIINDLDKLCSLRNSIEPEPFQSSFDSISRKLNLMDTIAKELRNPFWLIILLGLTYLTFLACFNLLPMYITPLTSYFLAIVSRTGGIIILFLFLMLLSMYFSLVQPMIRQTEYIRYLMNDNQRR